MRLALRARVCMVRSLLCKLTGAIFGFRTGTISESPVMYAKTLFFQVHGRDLRRRRSGRQDS